MGFMEIFHFDEEKYRQRVHSYPKEQAYQELARREVAKRRRIYSCKVKIVFCSLLLFPTCGATGVGLFIGIRQRHVAKKKYRHVKEAMVLQGLPLPIPIWKDKAYPFIINVIVYSLTLGLMVGLDEVGIAAANETAAYGLQGSANLVDPTMAGEAQQFVANPTDFVHGLLHGVDTQASELNGLIAPNQTMVGHAIAQNLEQPLSDTSVQYLSGETAGCQLAPLIERNAVVQLAAEGMERVAKVAAPRHPIARKPVAMEKTGVVTIQPVAMAKAA